MISLGFLLAMLPCILAYQIDPKRYSLIAAALDNSDFDYTQVTYDNSLFHDIGVVSHLALSSASRATKDSMVQLAFCGPVICAAGRQEGEATSAGFLNVKKGMVTFDLPTNTASKDAMRWKFSSRSFFDTSKPYQLSYMGRIDFYACFNPATRSWAIYTTDKGSCKRVQLYFQPSDYRVTYIDDSRDVLREWIS